MTVFKNWRVPTEFVNALRLFSVQMDLMDVNIQFSKLYPTLLTRLERATVKKLSLPLLKMALLRCRTLLVVSLLILTAVKTATTGSFYTVRCMPAVSIILTTAKTMSIH